MEEFCTLCDSLTAMDDLMKALLNGETDSTTLDNLLNNVLDVNCSWTAGRRVACSALMLAAMSNNSTAVRMLLMRGADAGLCSKVDFGPGPQSETPLITASRYGHIDIVRLLLSSPKCNVNFKCKGATSTALHTACNRGYKDIAAVLLEHGADIEENGYSGFTPLMEAIMEHHFDVVQLLAEHGALIFGQIPSDEKSPRDSPVMLAARLGFLDIVTFLLQAGSPTNQIDFYFGTSLLATSVRQEYDGLVQLLVMAGAEITDIDVETLFFNVDKIRTFMEKQKRTVQRLMEMSRIVVRESLIHNAQGQSILGLIEELPLPRQLQEYVALRIL